MVTPSATKERVAKKTARKKAPTATTTKKRGTTTTHKTRGKKTPKKAGASSNGLAFSVEDVSPNRCIADLAKAEGRNFRRMSESKIKKLSGIIDRNEWELTNDAIAYDSKGFLINGQHRFAAIARAGKTVKVLVVRGIDNSPVLDTGTSRSLVQYLTSIGEKNTSHLSAALRMVKLGLETDGDLGQLGRFSPSHTQLLSLLDEHPGVRDAITKAWMFQGIAKIPSIAAIRYLASLWFQDTDDFFDAAAKGRGKNDTDPTKALHGRLVRSRTISNSRITRMEEMALIIKAFNAWLDGRPISTLKWKGYGPRAEEFPVIGEGCETEE